MGGAAHLQQAGAVDGACVHGVTSGFVHRDAFARDGSLIYGAVAFKHYAIKRNALARFYAQHSTRLDGCYGCGEPLAIGLQYVGLLGREHHQGFNGIAGAVGSAAFNPFCNGV